MWELVFQTNLLSVVRLVRGALPHLRVADGGQILNIASTWVKQPIEGLLLSNTFRASIPGLTKSLAIELAPESILVNTIAPGCIDTDRRHHLNQLRAESTGAETAYLSKEKEYRYSNAKLIEILAITEDEQKQDRTGDRIALVE